jgi:hypothetical protein
MLLAIASFVAAIFSFFRQRQWQTASQIKTIEDRIQNLTDSLQRAATLISEIESEIQARSALAEQHQKDLDLYNKLVELKRLEVEA